jgi:hypothetical protein
MDIFRLRISELRDFRFEIADFFNPMLYALRSMLYFYWLLTALFFDCGLHLRTARMTW